MKPPRTRAQRRALDGLLEKGIIATAIGLALLLAPAFLKGSPLITALAAALRPAGWLALLLGLALVGLHTLLRRHVRPPARVTVVTAPSSRFQDSVLPQELLHPPRPVRLKPRRDFTRARPPGEQPTVPAALAPEPTPAPTPQGAAPLASWSPEVFAQIEWRRFEAVCEALFAQAGFRTQAQSHGADGGVDIWLHSRHAQGPVAVVQCKHWQGKPVGVKELREFYGVMSAHRLARGTYATSGRYTEEARAFARSQGINALDGAGLLRLIAQRTPAQQRQLLEVAYAGEYWRPTCARCGVKMVERQGGPDGRPFWGCRHYPRYRSTLPMPNGRGP